MGAQADCIFCKIVAGVIPSKAILDDEHCMAFMDVAPLAEGHVLLVPKQHYETLDQVPADIAAHLGSVLPKLTVAVTKATGAAGANVLQNNGRISGQVVPHVHFHVIPRVADDGLGYRWLAGEYGKGRADAVFETLKNAIQD